MRSSLGHNSIHRNLGLRNSAGFSLIEIITALAILGISLAGLIRLHLASMATADKAESLFQATLLAETKLNKILAEDETRPGTVSGSERRGSAVYQWQAIITREHVAGWPSRTPPQQIRLQVSWGQGRSRQQIELNTYGAKRRTE